MGKAIKKSEKKTAKPVMIQGTSSHAGKSLLTAALLRILRDRGFRAAPFKAQNMALNSFITVEGAEIGRAQAFQAEAAGVAPSADMNPVLLKPTGDSLSQVIIQGRVLGVMSALEFHGFKKRAARYVLESYRRLSSAYDVIVIEGAGSPAEVNLRKDDIANMGMAQMAGSPVIIVGDIDRGGVFASIVGTMQLLSKDERRRVKGFFINKFRGDMKLLTPGLEFLEKKSRRPVLGVVPYMKDLLLPDEDGVCLDVTCNRGARGGIRVSVVKLPRISNFTDLDPFRREEGVEVEFIEAPGDLKADMVVIPGTKNTIGDLIWMEEKGFPAAIRRYIDAGGVVFGICGGFQMLGRAITDPYGVESGVKSIKGLGLFDTQTVMMKKKNTCQVSAEAKGPGGRVFKVKGYEIHMGQTGGSVRPFAMITRRNDKPSPDGAVSDDGKVWGTYIHGIFDNDGFRAAFLDELRRMRGLEAGKKAMSFEQEKESSIVKVADMVEESVRMDEVMRIIGLG